MISDCPICKYEQINSQRDDHRDVYFIICPRCGEYRISRECIMFGQVAADLGYVLSGLSRELFEDNQKPPLFLTTTIAEQSKNYPVPDLDSVEEKSKKILKYIKQHTDFFGSEIQLSLSKDFSIGYSKNIVEFQALLQLLHAKKYINLRYEVATHVVDVAKIVLLVAGWDLANSLKKNNLESKQGFIAVWFEDSMNDSIKAMEEAIVDAGFKPLCIKDKHYSEMVRDKALGEIRKSRFVVVDLTGHRDSVFFEAGFAFGLDIEAIYVYKKNPEDQNSPLDFYVKHYQCHGYSNTEELKEIVRSAISARIKL